MRKFKFKECRFTLLPHYRFLILIMRKKTQNRPEFTCFE